MIVASGIYELVYQYLLRKFTSEIQTLAINREPFRAPTTFTLAILIQHLELLWIPHLTNRFKYLVLEWIEQYLNDMGVLIKRLHRLFARFSGHRWI